MPTSRMRRSTRVFFEAIRKNDKKLVAYLLQHGTNVRSRDIDGNSALHYAVLSKFDNVDMIQLLLKFGADLDFANYDGIRAYDIAFDQRKFKSLEFLLKSGARIDVDHFGGMLQQAPANIIDLLYQRVNVNEVSNMGLTALHHTVRVNDIEGVKLLLKKGADVNHQEPLEGSTPIYWASSAKCVEILLRHGAKPNLKHKWGGTLLFNICRGSPPNLTVPPKEQERIIEMLLEDGADVSDIINYCEVLLHYTVNDWNSLKELKLLLKLMAKMEDRFNYSGMEAMKIREKSQIGIFYFKCLKELAKMKKERIYGDLTFYDVITKTVSALMPCVRNENLLRAFERKKTKCRMFFPLYNGIVQRCFKQAVERNRLMEAASITLSRMMKCVNAQNVATQKIIEYLDVDDLQNLSSIDVWTNV